MYIADHAAATPGKPAMIIAETGAAITYRELDERSNRFAQFLYAQGLRRGDHVAILMENNLRFMEVVWAAFRSGLYITAVNRYLPPEDAAYVVTDCGAKAIVSSYDRREIAGPLAALIPDCPIRLMVDGVAEGWMSFEETVAPYPATPLETEYMGDTMLYSSGTTGRPKGIRRPLPERTVAEGFALRQSANRYGFSPDTVYLSPAPLYHAAPLGYVTNVQGYGGTVVMMQRFDPENALR
ncbi:MAG TPA: AMP-binding protein, partial [Caulobacteraceae bacterium]|nr:AMP-binding protein [Caulobacteraceae bacterium]